MDTIMLTSKEMAVKVLGVPYDYGCFFSVIFIKKDGSIRKMNCRRGVKKYLKGGDAAYNFAEKKLLPVFDIQKEDELGAGHKGAYRSINTLTVMELRLEGLIYRTEEYYKHFSE